MLGKVAMQSPPAAQNPLFENAVPPATRLICESSDIEPWRSLIRGDNLVQLLRRSLS